MGDDRSRDATERVRRAALRAEELRALRLKLAAGDGLSSDDVELAERRQGEAAGLAEQAHQRAAAAHRRAAEAHRAAADSAERLGRSSAAATHRRAADTDEAAARDDDAAAHADDPEPGSPVAPEQGGAQ